MIEDEEIEKKDEDKNKEVEQKSNEERESIGKEYIEEKKEDIENKPDINAINISEDEILIDKNKDKNENENKLEDVIKEDKAVKEEENNIQEKEKDSENIDNKKDDKTEDKLPEKEEDKEKEKSGEIEEIKENNFKDIKDVESNDQIEDHADNKLEEKKENEKEEEKDKIVNINEVNDENIIEQKNENIEKIKENDIENKNDEIKENEIEETNEIIMEEKKDNINENKIEEINNNIIEGKPEEITENKIENKNEEIKENKNEEIKENKIEEIKENKKEGIIENKIEELHENKNEEIIENKNEEIKENKIEEIKENKEEEIIENKIEELHENKIEELHENKVEEKHEEIKENKIENNIKEKEENKLENKIEEIKEKKLENKNEEIMMDNIIENKKNNNLEMKKDNKTENIKEINKENKNENKKEVINYDEEFKKNNTFTFSKNIEKKTIPSKSDDINPKNIKEINKLKEVLLKSFTTEPVTEQKEKKEDKVVDNFILLDKTEEDEDLIFLGQNNKKKKPFIDIYKYKNELNLKKKLKKFHLFYNEIKNPGDDNAIYKVGKVLLFTYRKNFPKITSYKTKKTYTTDAWWGCMVRCGQMILSRGIYRLLKATGMDTKTAIMNTVPLFSHYPISRVHPYFQGMLTKYKTLKNMNEKKEKIKDFFPPFSIKTLCDVGELFERTAGEWFSDVIITQVFKKISEYFDLFNHPLMNVKIMTFQSCIQIPDILNSCFIEKKKEKDNLQYIHYYFDKMGIVFVNVRVGLDKIPKEYFKGIKGLFELKECIGIIGGKTRLAYYFIGYDNDNDSLLYLDPHVTKEADKEVTLHNVLGKHINKEVHLLKMTKMSTAFTIGFCFRNYDEFLHLFEFWQKAKQDKLPILGIVKQPIVIDFKDNVFTFIYIDSSTQLVIRMSNTIMDQFTQHP